MAWKYLFFSLKSTCWKSMIAIFHDENSVSDTKKHLERVLNTIEKTWFLINIDMYGLEVTPQVNFMVKFLIRGVWNPTWIITWAFDEFLSFFGKNIFYSLNRITSNNNLIKTRKSNSWYKKLYRAALNFWSTFKIF